MVKTGVACTVFNERIPPGCALLPEPLSLDEAYLDVTQNRTGWAGVTRDCVLFINLCSPEESLGIFNLGHHQTNDESRLVGNKKAVQKRALRTPDSTLPGTRRIIKGRPFEVGFEFDAKLYRKEHPYGH